jgi:hypothetical protein
MARSLRERVTIDLRGIGDAVRAAAAGRGQTLAAYARAALVAAADCQPPTLQRLEPPAPRPRAAIKLHLRMDEREAEVLVVKARLLGLSYGEYVGRLVVGTPLPAPLAQRAAERAALQASTDHLAVLAREISEVLRLARAGKSAEEVKQRIGHLHNLEADVRCHLDRASSFLADRGQES